MELKWTKSSFSGTESDCIEVGRPEWAKSTFSDNHAAGCVELHHTLAAVRDSKNVDAPHVDVNEAAVRGLVAYARAF